MTYNILFPTTTVTASTHILQRGEPGYDETTNTLKIGDGSTTFAALQAIGSEGSGDVVGPSSATDHAIARYDLTTGKLIQDSSATIDDSGNVTASSFVGPLTGNADTASTLETTRTITLTGDISGSTSFNGGANVSITSTLPTVATAGTYKSVTVNTKGQVTAGTNPTTLAGYGITDASLTTHNHSGVYQPIDTDLTAIAALSGTYGFLKKTAANTWSIDTIEYLSTSIASDTYLPLTSGTLTGDLWITGPGTSTLGVRSTDGALSQIIIGGYGGSGNRLSYFDMVSDDTYTYGFRIARNGGMNGGCWISTHGTGGVSLRTIEAGNIIFVTNSVNRAYFSTAGNLLCSTDNAINCGGAANRWANIWAANGTIQTSDERAKTNITASDIGLGFILGLKPVSYRFKVGQNDVTTVESGKFEEDGVTPIVKEIVTPRAGVRTHYGMIAQQVKTVIDDAGIDDFAGFIYDDETDTYGLRYEEFIAPLIKAVQELSVTVDTLKDEIAQLKGVSS